MNLPSFNFFFLKPIFKESFPESRQAKIAFVIGHNSRSKGASNILFKPEFGNEFDFNSKALKELKKLDVNFDIYIHNPFIFGYKSRMKNTIKEINKKDYDYVFPLHFNAAADVRANGVEALYYFLNKDGLRVAQLFAKIVNKNTLHKDNKGISIRGNKGGRALISPSDRGYWAVFLPKATTVLLEGWFGSNYRDNSKIRSPYNFALILEDFISKL